MKLQPLKDKILVLPEPRIQSTLWIKTAEADTIGTSASAVFIHNVDWMRGSGLTRILSLSGCSFIVAPS